MKGSMVKQSARWIKWINVATMSFKWVELVELLDSIEARCREESLGDIPDKPVDEFDGEASACITELYRLGSILSCAIRSHNLPHAVHTIRVMRVYAMGLLNE